MPEHARLHCRIPVELHRRLDDVSRRLSDRVMMQGFNVSKTSLVIRLLDEGLDRIERGVNSFEIDPEDDQAIFGG